MQLLLDATGSKDDLDKVFFNDDSNKVAMIKEDDYLRSIDLSTGMTKFLDLSWLDGASDGYRLSKDGKNIYIADNNEVHKYNFKNNTLEQLDSYSYNNLTSYAINLVVPFNDFEESKKIFAVHIYNTNPDRIYCSIIDTETNTEVKNVGYEARYTSYFHEYAVSEDNRFILLKPTQSNGDDHEDIVVFDMEEGTHSVFSRHNSFNQEVNTIDFISARTVVSGDVSGRLIKWNVETRAVIDDADMHDTTGIYDICGFDRTVWEEKKTKLESLSTTKFKTDNLPVVEGSVSNIFELSDITSNITSSDLAAGSITLSTAIENPVLADYTWLEKAEITNEQLSDSGDSLTFNFSNENVEEGSVTIKEESDIAGDVDSYDLQNGSVTLLSEHTGDVIADYKWLETIENPVDNEGLTNTGDNLNFEFNNSPIKSGSITVYESGQTEQASDDTLTNQGDDLNFSTTYDDLISGTIEVIENNIEKDVAGETLTTVDNLTFQLTNSDIVSGTVTAFESDRPLDVTGEQLTNTGDDKTFTSANSNLVDGSIVATEVNSEHPVIGESLTDSGDGLTFNFANSPLKSGSVTVYDNSNDVTSNVTIDETAGTVTFSTAPTGPVTADYTWIDTTENTIIDDIDQSNTDLAAGTIVFLNQHTGDVKADYTWIDSTQVEITSNISSVDTTAGSVTFTDSHKGVVTADYSWVDGTNVNITGDISTVDSANGVITFTNAHTGDLRANYSYINDTKVDITADISSSDLSAGTVTFATEHTGTLTADYTWTETSQNSVSQETLTTSDNLTFNFANSPLVDGSISNLIETKNIDSDVASYDYTNGSVTFTNTHTGIVYADYINVNSENEITHEVLTTEDNTTFSFTNAPIKDGTITIYEKIDIVNDLSSINYEKGELLFSTSHSGEVYCDHKWFGDAEKIVSVGRTLKLYDSENYTLYDELDLGEVLRYVDISPDGTRMVVVGSQGLCHIYSLGFSVVTHRATNIDHDSMKLNGEIYNLGNYSELVCSFEYTTDPNFENNIMTTPKHSMTEKGNFNHTVTGLNSDTKYYYRAIAEPKISS